MFHTHPFGGLISVFTPSVYEGQLGLTLDMQIDPILCMPYLRIYFSVKQKVTGLSRSVDSNQYRTR